MTLYEIIPYCIVSRLERIRNGAAHTVTDIATKIKSYYPNLIKTDTDCPWSNMLISPFCKQNINLWMAVQLNTCVNYCPLESPLESSVRPIQGLLQTSVSRLKSCGYCAFSPSPPCCALSSLEKYKYVVKTNPWHNPLRT